MKILKAVIVLGTMYPTAFFANAADAGGGAAGDDVIQEEEQHVTTTSSSSTRGSTRQLQSGRYGSGSHSKSYSAKSAKLAKSREGLKKSKSGPPHTQNVAVIGE